MLAMESEFWRQLSVTDITGAGSSRSLQLTEEVYFPGQSRSAKQLYIRTCYLQLYEQLNRWFMKGDGRCFILLGSSGTYVSGRQC